MNADIPSVHAAFVLQLCKVRTLALEKSHATLCNAIYMLCDLTILMLRGARKRRSTRGGREHAMAMPVGMGHVSDTGLKRQRLHPN